MTEGSSRSTRSWRKNAEVAICDFAGELREAHECIQSGSSQKITAPPNGALTPNGAICVLSAYSACSAFNFRHFGQPERQLADQSRGGGGPTVFGVLEEAGVLDAAGGID